MIYLEAFLFATVTLLLTSASISDLQTSRVPNKTILLFIGLGIVGVVPYYVFFAQDCVFPYFVNIALSTGVSIILYSTGVWGAGDCKLLITTILLFPARLYCMNNRSVASCFMLISFVFISAFLFIIGETIVLGIKRKDLWRRARFHFDLKAYTKSFLFFFLFLNLWNVLLSIVAPESILTDVLLLTAIHFILLLLTMQIEDKASWPIIGGMAAVWVLLIYLKIAHFSVSSINWKTYIVIVLLLSFRTFADKYNYKSIPVAELKTGMILSMASIVLFSGSKVQGLPESSTEDLKSRLTVDEVDSIKRWSKAKAGRESVIIVRKIPFALFIAIGTLIFVVWEVLVL